MINRETAEHYTWGDCCDGWHFIRKESLSIIYERMPPSTSEVRHFHQNSWQFFFVLSGTALLEIDGEYEVLQPSQGLEVLAGTPHQMFNESEHDLEFLVISQPPSHGDRVLV